MDDKQWIESRGWLKHDFLGKTYPNTLGIWDRIRSGQVKYPEFVERMREWTHKRDRIRTFLHGTLDAMSPKNLLSRPPLNRLPDADRLWLASVVDRNWRSNYDVPATVARALTIVDEADGYFMKLDDVIANGPDSELPDRMNRHDDIFRLFFKSIKDLHDAIDKLPPRIKVL